MSTGRVLAVILGLVLLGVGVGTLPGSVENRALSEDLLRRGTTVTATTAEAYVVLSSGTRGGDYLEVEDLRVRLPAGTLGLDNAQWVVLEGASPESLEDPVPRGWVDHWVTTSDKTGYTAPVAVSVLLDGRREPRAMAVADLDGWSGPDSTVLSATVAALGMLVLALVAFRIYRGRHRATYLGG